MTIGSHQTTIGKSQTYLTPLWILDALGDFDLDPCAAPEPRPWPTARNMITLPEDGLSLPWTGRVWLNPPFNRYEVGRWIERLAEHGDGTALVHARTEAKWFQPLWERADAILFLSRRVKFHNPDGTLCDANSGAPVVLAAFGRVNAARLRNLPGWIVENRFKGVG